MSQHYLSWLNLRIHCNHIGNATIGFNSDGSYFRVYEQSGSNSVSDIACDGYPQTIWSNLVYPLVPDGRSSTLQHIHTWAHIHAHHSVMSYNMAVAIAEPANFLIAYCQQQ